MNQVIKVVETANSPGDVLSDACFDVDVESFNRAIEGAVYGRRFTRHLLIKLDYLLQDHSHRMSLETLSVEHVLPQNPEATSQWYQDFNEEQREEWTHRLGNLVLVTMRKNTSLGRLDYIDKKARYFEKRISTCPNSLRVLTDNTQWTLAELSANHQLVLQKLRTHYGTTA